MHGEAIESWFYHLWLSFITDTDRKTDSPLWEEKYHKAFDFDDLKRATFVSSLKAITSHT